MRPCRYGHTHRRKYSDSDSESSETLAELKASRRRWVPSLLTRLHGSAFKPEVDDGTVGYVEGTNKGTPSDMNMMELNALAKFFPWPKGIKLRLPCANGGSLANYPGCIVVHEKALKAGFRLPLHPFICDFLSDTRLCPAQLTPNAWRSILAFLLKFKDLNLVPSYEAFKSMYTMRAQNGIYSVIFQGVNLISNPKNGKLWDTKWFLVCQSEEFHFNFPTYPGNFRFCKGNTRKQGEKIESEVQELIQIFKSLPRQPGLGFKKILDVSRLEEAGLSLTHPVKGRAGPVDMYVRYIAQRKRKVGCFEPKSKNMELPNKKAKTCLSPKDLAASPTEIQPEEEKEEEEDPEEDPEEEEEKGEGEEHELEEEGEEEDPPLEEEEEEEDPEEELSCTNTQDVFSEDAPISSAHVDGEKEFSEDGGKIDGPLEGGCEGTSLIGTLCRPEVSTALRQLPEILLAAQYSEELGRQLDESRREIDELKRENAKLVSRIERLELDKSNLMEVTQKAKEFVEISSSLLKAKH